MDECSEVRTDGNSLLKAVSLSRLRLTRLLLEGGAYINESNEHGETPLIVSCKSHSTDSQSVPKHKMVRYLLENGADPNIQDKLGKTALMHACVEQAGTEILSLLLSSGANPTLEDHNGLSALVYAVNSGDRDVLRILLDACKMKGKEVIIITTNKLPSGHQLTKQYLNVPPPPELDERLHYTPSCCTSADKLQGSSAMKNLQCCCSGPGIVISQPTSPTQHPSRAPAAEKRLHLHRLNSEPWRKGPSPLLQQSQTCSLTQVPVEASPDADCTLRFGCRPPTVSRHHSIDVKDTKGLLRALEGMSGNESRGFGRKMSYDSAAASLHSASHPDLHQDSLPFPHESGPVDKDSSNCLRQLHVSSLKNVVCRRNIGMNHYSSDSQLPQFGSRENHNRSSGAGAAVGSEKKKLLSSRSSGSRESLETLVQRRDPARFEGRGSGTLLSYTGQIRPGYLPPLNSHAPIPDIGLSSRASKTLNSGLPTSKSILPSAPVFPKYLQTNKMLWRRHSMQSEQMNQLVNFEGPLGH